MFIETSLIHSISLGNSEIEKNFEKLNFKKLKETLKMIIIDSDILKIDIEDVVPSFKFAAEDFICLICKNIVNEPKKCSSCDKLFCNNCITDGSKKSHNQCPMKCGGTRIDQPGRTILNILSKIEFKCRLCAKITTYEKYSKHLNECENREYKCSGNGCNYKNNLSKMYEHFFKCEYVTQKCILCSIQVLVKDKDNHINTCEGKIINCKFCSINLKKKELVYHSREKCFSLVVSNYQTKIKGLEKEIEILKSKLN